jgi:protein-disulfide isomerase
MRIVTALCCAGLSVVVSGAAAQTPPAAPPPAQAPPSVALPFVVQPPQDVVAQVGGKQISLKDVDAKAGGRVLTIRNQEYQLRRTALDELIAVEVLAREAAARQISVEQLVAAEIEARVTPVTDEEVRLMYDSAPASARNLPEAEGLKSLAESMRKQRLNVRRVQLVSELRRKFGVRAWLDAPRLAIAPQDANEPSRGPIGAPITLVEFSDYQCPFCARATDTLKQVEARYPGKIRRVFRDFPLPIHADAPKAAEAAGCAGDQSKFWEMHDELFKNAQSLKTPDLVRIAGGLGLDTPAFTRCLEAGTHAAGWTRDKAEGERYGVAGTPAIFINGRPLQGAAPLQEFVRIIDEELERVGQSVSQSAALSAQPRP